MRKNIIIYKEACMEPFRPAQVTSENYYGASESAILVSERLIIS